MGDILVIVDGQLLYLLRYHSVNALPVFDVASYFSAAYVEQWCRYNSYAIWYILNIGPLPWIYNDGIVGQDVFMMIPFIEGCPIVATNKKGERNVGVIRT